MRLRLGDRRGGSLPADPVPMRVVDDMREVKFGPVDFDLERPPPGTAAGYRLDGTSFPIDAVMAIDPAAFDRTFISAFRTETKAKQKPYAMAAGGVAVIDIMGPLARRAFASWFWFIDGYDFIEERFAAAMDDPEVDAVVLRIDSPGGSASGAFDAVSRMRGAKLAAGKTVFTYADDLAASAGYALATVGDKIFLPESGMIGSVGVIGVLAEQSAALKEAGINVRVLTTGAEKADGHPAVPMTEAMVKRYQARIDHLGGLFFAQVADARGMTAGAVKALEAGVFQGADAIKAGLADGISTFDDVVDMIRQAKTGSTGGVGKERVHMATQATAANSGSAGTGDSSPPTSKTIALIALSMGLAASASDEEVMQCAAELRGLREQVFALTGKTEASEALGVLQAASMAAKAVPDLQKRLGELQAEGIARNVDAAISAAKLAGKVTNAEMESQLRQVGEANLGQLTALLQALPALVTQATATREPSKDATGVLSASDMTVAKQLGLTREQFIEARKAQAADVALAQEGVA